MNTAGNPIATYTLGELAAAGRPRRTVRNCFQTGLRDRAEGE